MVRVLVAVLASLVLGGAAPAAADDPPPLLPPPGVSAPPDDGTNQVPPGPTYVITPGSDGTELGEPADQAEIDRAREPDATSTADPTPTRTPAPARTPGSTVAGPEAPGAAPDVASDPVPAPALGRWWVIGAGAVLLLVLVEAARSAVRWRARRAG